MIKKYNQFIKESKEDIIDIHAICDKYYITNYSINEDGSINVDGDVNLSRKNLIKLPLRFRNVTGYFNCNSNLLTTLEGCPVSVGGDFRCRDNKLTSLQGSPKEVGSYLDCSDNNIKTFEGCPEFIGEWFYCVNNPISGIYDLFVDVTKIDLFNDFDIIRDDTVIKDRLISFLIEIGKEEEIKNVDYIGNYKLI
jgi:hypothetical protein